jgi:protoheme IX farnesyltransferase
LRTQIRLADYIEITRPRIVATVALTTLTGYIAVASSLNVPRIMALTSGVSLIAASATALNQVFERSSDARMFRTRNRPMARGRIPYWNALGAAWVMCLLGFVLLAEFNAASAWLALTALVSYAFIYTPLKRVSSISLYVGALPGALPPLIGSLMAENQVSAKGMLLFVFLFVWQLPHFLAIGWLHRGDYSRAGFRVLAVEDYSGMKSALTALTTSMMLLVFVGYAATAKLWNPWEAIVSAISVVALIEFARRFLSIRSRIGAKRLFLYSNICLLIAMLAQIVAASFRLWER